MVLNLRFFCDAIGYAIGYAIDDILHVHHAYVHNLLMMFIDD